MADSRPASGETLAPSLTPCRWLHVTLQRDFTLLILILRTKAQKWLDQGGAVCVSTVWSPAEGTNEYCKLRTQVHSCSLFISLNFTIPTHKRQESWLPGRGTVGSQGIRGMAHLAKQAESGEGVKKANVSGFYAYSHQPCGNPKASSSCLTQIPLSVLSLMGCPRSTHVSHQAASGPPQPQGS